MVGDEKGYTPELWKKLSAANLTGLAIPEGYGGFGDFIDLIVVLEEMGRACFISPFFASVVLGAGTITEAGSEAQKEELLPQIAEGKIIVTLALTERSGKYAPDAVNLKAEKKGESYLLNGVKMFVPDGQNADYLIVAARMLEEADPEKGITLFIVDAKPQDPDQPAATVSLTSRLRLSLPICNRSRARCIMERR
jgi:alkylation response protein AidB-like acyl-CoA dehydrogenase